MLGIEVLTKGVKLSLLLSKNTIAPKGSLNEIDKRLRGLISKGTVERRMMEKASIAVVFNERQHSCVGFANSRGDADLNCCFLAVIHISLSGAMITFNTNGADQTIGMAQKYAKFRTLLI